MAYEALWAAALTGGGTGAVDKIPTADLTDKDMVHYLGPTLSGHYSVDDDSAATEASPWVIQPDDETGDKRLVLVDFVAPNIYAKLFKAYDTDFSHTLTLKWNEAEATADRVLNLLVNGGNRSLDLAENLKVLDGQDIELHASGGEKAQLAIDTQNAERTLNLSENLTVGDGYNVTLQALGQANSLILNESLTLGDGHSGTLTFSAASKVMTVAGNCTLNDWFDQAVKSASSPAFANPTVTTLNALTPTAADTGFTIAGGTTPKTLTLNDDFNVSTQLSAIGANTDKVTNATHSGDATGATELTIAAEAVTLAKMANMATASFIGRTTAETGVPEILSKANALAILNVADGADVTADNAPKAHTASHAVGGADTIFPADPGADKYLMWDDSESALSWEEADEVSFTNVNAALAAADAAIDFNAQNLTNVGTITTTGNIVLPANGVIGVTDGSPQIRFDNTNDWLEIAGDVIVGGTTKVQSTADFEVQGSFGGIGSVRTTDNAYGAFLQGSKSRLGGVITTGDTLFGIYIRGHDGSDYATIGAQILFDSTGVIDTNKIPTNIKFLTASGATADDVTEKWRMDSVGNFDVILHDGATVGLKLGGTLIEKTAAQINALVTNATHSGEVTGATELTIAAEAVTLAKMANMATDSFIGRTTAEVGVPEILSKADALAILNVADGADVTGSNAPQAHTASHAVGGADTIFPADPGVDKYLMWDDDPGVLVWAAGVSGAINDLTDVTITGPTHLDILQYVTDAWVDRSLSEAGIQPLDATLTSIALLGTATNKMLYTSGIDTWAEAAITAAGRALLDDANVAAQRTTLELGADVTGFATVNAILAVANAAVDLNSQDLTSVGAVGCGIVTCGGIVLGDDDTIGCTGGPILTFDDTADYLTLTANDKLILLGGSDVSLDANSGDFIIGAIAGQHIAFDNNEIQSKSDGTTAGTLLIQHEGGNLSIGAPTTVPDHGAAATDEVVNVCYGTGAEPAANTTTIGSLFIKYVA